MEEKKKKRTIIKYYLLIAILFNFMVFMYHSDYLKHITDVIRISTTEEVIEENFGEINEETKIEDVIDEVINETNKLSKPINAKKKNLVQKINDVLFKSSESNNSAGQSEPNSSTEDEEIVLKLFENSEDFNEIRELDIFKDAYDNNMKKNIIYPGLHGEYIFKVENLGKEEEIYNLDFIEESADFVNMKYYIKRNGISLTGTEDEYYDISIFSLKNLKIKANSFDEYTLYWKWIDNDVVDVKASDEINRAIHKLKIRGSM